MSVDSVLNVLKTLWRESAIFIINQVHDSFSTIHHLGFRIFISLSAKNRWLIFFTSSSGNGGAFLKVLASFLILHLSVIRNHNLTRRSFRILWQNHWSWFLSRRSCIFDILVNRLLLNRMKRMRFDNLTPLIVNLWTYDLQ